MVRYNNNEVEPDRERIGENEIHKERAHTHVSITYRVSMPSRPARQSGKENRTKGTERLEHPDIGQR